MSDLFDEALASLRKDGDKVVKREEQPREHIHGSYTRAAQVLEYVKRAGLPAPEDAWVVKEWTVLYWGDDDEELLIYNDPPHTVTTMYNIIGVQWMSELDTDAGVNQMLAFVRHWVDEDDTESETSSSTD